jgi:hypothetical protein
MLLPPLTPPAFVQDCILSYSICFRAPPADGVAVLPSFVSYTYLFFDMEPDLTASASLAARPGTLPVNAALRPGRADRGGIEPAGRIRGAGAE